jgi:hypothetical protein
MASEQQSGFPFGTIFVHGSYVDVADAAAQPDGYLYVFATRAVSEEVGFDGLSDEDKQHLGQQGFVQVLLMGSWPSSSLARRTTTSNTPSGSVRSATRRLRRI